MSEILVAVLFMLLDMMSGSGKAIKGYAKWLD